MTSVNLEMNEILGVEDENLFALLTDSNRAIIFFCLIQHRTITVLFK
jgi:hypothetical protein